MANIAVILVLPIEYNTSSMLRCRAIISALGEMGHKIKCYCPNPDSNSKYYSKEMVDIPGIEIFRFGGTPWSETKRTIVRSKRRNFRLKIMQMALSIYRRFDVFGSTLLYFPERKRISDDIAKGSFDILLSFSDPIPAHMIAKYCKQHNPHLKYIQQWGDPLASDTISKTAQPVWVRKLIEDSLLKLADKICYVSPFTCEEQKRLFKKYSKKMIFLPTPCLKYIENEYTSEKLCLGYFGSYNSGARNIRPFYEAAKKNQDTEFLIIGDSDLKLESTHNVTIINRISLEELNKYIHKVNVIVCLMNSKGNQIPGKVYHDASSTKDILLIKDGEYGDEIQKFFEKYNHYTFVENTVSSIDIAIKQYVRDGIPIRKPVKDFEAASIAKKLIE